MQLNLIWTQPPESLSEASWIRWLFSNLDVTEYVAPRLELLKENSIYIVSSNRYPLSSLPAQFVEGLRTITQKGLFQISDESYSGGYEVYTEFDFVLRNYHSSIFQHPGIMILPLGPANNAMEQLAIEAATDRKFVWSFAGSKTAARIEMYENFKDIEPHHCRFYESRKHEKPLLDARAFMTLLSQTVFCPCPMGNVMLETFRLYESLQMGCIPIAERRWRMPYYDLLMPGHPLPTFSSWREAKQFVQRLSKDQARLAEYQHAIANWWQNYKLAVRTDVTAFVSLGLHGEFRSSLVSDWQPRKGVRHQMWRIAELLKHANRPSLQERIGIVGSRVLDCISIRPTKVN
jgi:hypothetical protein